MGICRWAFLFLVLSVTISLDTSSHADFEDSVKSRVICTVEPTVTVEPPLSVDELNVHTGTVSGTLTFRIDANVDFLNLSVGVSNLYKAGDPNSEVEPILVHQPSGVIITPYSGSDDTVAYAAASEINGFPAEQTGAHVFQSSQNGHFSQYVDITIAWDQTDPDKPQGEYSGYVHFRAMLLQ